MDLAAVVGKSKIIANTYGVRYQREIMVIYKWSPNLLSNDWFASMEFWFSKSFYRGRRDEISDNFFTCALSVMKGFEKKRLLDMPPEEMAELLVNAGVNNHIDRLMIIQSLKFIKENKVQQIHSELQSIFGLVLNLQAYIYEIYALPTSCTRRTRDNCSACFPWIHG